MPKPNPSKARAEWQKFKAEFRTEANPKFAALTGLGRALDATAAAALNAQNLQDALDRTMHDLRTALQAVLQKANEQRAAEQTATAAIVAALRTAPNPAMNARWAEFHRNYDAIRVIEWANSMLHALEAMDRATE
jgi:hypothetical protein